MQGYKPLGCASLGLFQPIIDIVICLSRLVSISITSEHAWMTYRRFALYMTQIGQETGDEERRERVDWSGISRESDGEDRNVSVHSN